MHHYLTYKNCTHCVHQSINFIPKLVNVVYTGYVSKFTYMKNLYYVFSSCFSYCFKAEAYI